MQVKASKVLSTCLLLATVGCGDVIRDPRSPGPRDFPDENSSVQLGRCANFSGRWTALCDNRPALLPEKFDLLQQSCELFQLLPEGSSFNLNSDTKEPSVIWSNNNYEVQLTNANYSLHFRMMNGQRKGVWSVKDSGVRDCQLHWWPN
jgi:hypothetical protein